MYNLSYLFRKTASSAYRRSGTIQSTSRTRLNLEELEQRDVPAPIVTSPVATSVLLAAQAHAVNGIPNPVLNITATSPFNAAQALAFTGPGTTISATSPSGTGVTITPAFASGPGQLTVVPPSAFSPNGFSPLVVSSNAFPGIGFPAVVGVPNPVRLGPPIPETPGSTASMPRTPQYITEDIALSGGGGGLSDESEFRTEDPDPTNPQTWIESSTIAPTDSDVMPTSLVLREAIFQLTV